MNLAKHTRPAESNSLMQSCASSLNVQLVRINPILQQQLNHTCIVPHGCLHNGALVGFQRRTVVHQNGHCLWKKGRNKIKKRKERNMHGKNTLQEGHSLAHKFLRLPTRLFTQLVNISSASPLNEPWGRKLTEVCSCQRALIQHAMGDLAADRPAWWCWTYLGLSQSSSQLQMISPTLARWH